MTSKPMATLYYAEVFTLHRVRFRFQSQLLTTGMGSESESRSESVSGSVNKPLRFICIRAKMKVEGDVAEDGFMGSICY